LGGRKIEVSPTKADGARLGTELFCSLHYFGGVSGVGSVLILPSELRAIAKARLRDAEILLSARRYDGSVYLCGYSVEIGLKARICRSLKWDGFPSTNKEFEGLHNFRTHKLDVLLHLSGAEKEIKAKYFVECQSLQNGSQALATSKLAPQLRPRLPT